jgi:hypothetical protein
MAVGTRRRGKKGDGRQPALGRSRLATTSKRTDGARCDRVRHSVIFRSRPPETLLCNSQQGSACFT